MTKVIPLPSTSAYFHVLDETRKMLKETEENLFIQAINLCSCSTWMEWSKNQEDGIAVEFDTEMLTESGDKNALILVEVMAALNEAREGLKYR